MQLITAPAPFAPLRTGEARRAPVRIGLVQMRWIADPAAHVAALREGIHQAAAAGATAVFLPELTLRRYPGDQPAAGTPKDDAEDLLTGPTFSFAAEAARDFGVLVHASLYERPADADRPEDGRGYNTAILVDPTGSLVGRTRKTHIPISAGYYEDTFFRPGIDTEPHPVYAPEGLGARVGLPTCWDEWFPELSRAYGLAGAEILAYPTAIGSEPSFPDFDTRDIWRHVITANGITSGLFMVVPNRWGDEGDITFYGSSFISDPFGRILVEAPRDASAVLVADLDIEQREEWLQLFPFYVTRRPDQYAALVAPVDEERDGYGAVAAALAASAGAAVGGPAGVAPAGSPVSGTKVSLDDPGGDDLLPLTDGAPAGDGAPVGGTTASAGGAA